MFGPLQSKVVILIFVAHIDSYNFVNKISQMYNLYIFLSFVQVGGTWQKGAVALMREVLLNRSVDLHVMVKYITTYYIPLNIL